MHPSSIQIWLQIGNQSFYPVNTAFSTTPTYHQGLFKAFRLLSIQDNKVLQVEKPIVFIIDIVTRTAVIKNISANL